MNAPSRLPVPRIASPGPPPGAPGYVREANRQALAWARLRATLGDPRAGLPGGAPVRAALAQGFAWGAAAGAAIVALAVALALLV